MRGRGEKPRFRGMKSGFTLLELLLVIIVTLILAGTAINGIIRSQGIFQFNGAFQNVSSLIREARSYAVTGKAVIDYTDYDGDGCKEGGAIAAHDAGCTLVAGTPDYVTPANYGIHFSGNTMTLFADLHGSATEGVYDTPPAGFMTYAAGKDMRIAEYELPVEYAFAFNPAGVNTIMYSPIFADTSFNDTVTDFFVFGVKETSGNRNRCMAVHKVSGIPEDAEKANVTCP